MTYEVIGMTCEGCVRSVKRVIAATSPGVGVEVELSTGWVTVTGEHAPEAIREAVEGAGFELTGAVV